MPRRGATEREQRQRFLEDYKVNCYPISELVERFTVSRKTAYQGIDQFGEYGQSGCHELSRRPHSSPSQADPALVEALINLRKAGPRRGPRKLLDLMHQRDPSRELPAVSSADMGAETQGRQNDEAQSLEMPALCSHHYVILAAPLGHKAVVLPTHDQEISPPSPRW